MSNYEYVLLYLWSYYNITKRKIIRVFGKTKKQKVCPICHSDKIIQAVESKTKVCISCRTRFYKS